MTYWLGTKNWHDSIIVACLFYSHLSVSVCCSRDQIRTNGGFFHLIAISSDSRNHSKAVHTLWLAHVTTSRCCSIRSYAPTRLDSFYLLPCSFIWHNLVTWSCIPSLWLISLSAASVPQLITHGRYRTVFGTGILLLHKEFENFSEIRFFRLYKYISCFTETFISFLFHIYICLLYTSRCV